MSVRLNTAARNKVFGPPCVEGNIATITTPWGIRVRCHQLLIARFLDTCEVAKARSRWVPRRIDSYNCRRIRGGNEYSLHSWALAWDFFDLPLSQVPDIWGPTNAPPPEFRQVFTDAGFTAGADFSGRADFPHLEWAGGVPVGPSVKPPAIPVAQGPQNGPVHDYEEAQVRSQLMFIGPLDDQGNGWSDWQLALGRDPIVVGAVLQGPSPPDDGNYWIDQAKVNISAQPRGGVVRVVVRGGKPGDTVGVYVSVA